MLQPAGSSRRIIRRGDNGTHGLRRLADAIARTTGPTAEVIDPAELRARAALVALGIAALLALAVLP